MQHYLAEELAACIWQMLHSMPATYWLACLEFVTVASNHTSSSITLIQELQIVCCIVALVGWQQLSTVRLFHRVVKSIVVVFHAVVLYAV
jgi:hypothetical protein